MSTSALVSTNPVRAPSSVPRLLNARRRDFSKHFLGRTNHFSWSLVLPGTHWGQLSDPGHRNTHQIQASADSGQKWDYVKLNCIPCFFAVIESCIGLCFAPRSQNPDDILIIVGLVWDLFMEQLSLGFYRCEVHLTKLGNKLVILSIASWCNQAFIYLLIFYNPDVSFPKKFLQKLVCYSLH